MEAINFIKEKEHEVENLFKDWHIEKLASVLEEYAELKNNNKSELINPNSCPYRASGFCTA